MASEGERKEAERVAAAIASLDSQIQEVRDERDGILEQDPDSHLVDVLDQALVEVQDIRTMTLLEAVFGGVEILDVGAGSDEPWESIATLKDPPAPRSELARNNLVEDGVPLAHSTLFADADEH